MRAYWHVTNRCNINCTHCYMRSNRQKYEEKTSDVLSYIVGNKEITAVTITGGEPLLVPNLIDIIGKLSEANKTICLYTNGYLLCENFLVDIAGQNIEKIRISVDSGISNVNGRSINLNRLTELGDLITRMGIDFEVGVTIFPGVNDTKSHIETLWSLAEDKGYIFSISPAFPHTIEAGLEILLSERSLRLLFEYRYGVEILDKLKSNTCYECSALKKVISILPSGQISPCDNLAGTLVSKESIINMPLGTIIKTEPLFHAIENHNVGIIQQCKKCRYRNVCNGGCRAIAYFNGNIKGCDTRSYQRLEAFHNKYQVVE